MVRGNAYPSLDTVEDNVAFADLCTLLATLLQFPTEELAEGVANGTVCADAAAIAREAGLGADAVRSVEEGFACLTGGDRRGVHELMRREHTRLFDHPDQPAVRPFEAQFLYDEARARGEDHATGMLAGMPPSYVNNAALDAERCYRAAGLVRDATSYNVPADHVCTELEFLAVLHARRADALLHGDARAAVDAQDRLEEFGRIHVRRWFGAFFGALAARGTGAYACAGELGAAFARRVAAGAGE